MMRYGDRKARSTLVAGLTLVFIIIGMSGCGRSEKDYRPSVENARVALEAALDAWQKGTAKKEEPIQPADKPGMVVQLVDGDFTAGNKLVSWKIESGEPQADGPSQFKVKLEFVAGKPPIEATFYVTGIAQHYSIFRDKEYQQRAGQM